MTTIGEILYSNENSISVSEKKLLLSYVLGLSYEKLNLTHSKKVGEKDLKNFEQLIIRRKNSEPIAYLTNKKSFWKNGKNATADGVRVIRCPAEYLENLGCVNCGGKDGPLCARLNRDFIIGFTGHGASKKKIENEQRGGCYAAGGNVAIHWRATAGQEQEQTDGDKLRAFVKTLSPRAIIRHHVAGDIGAE